MENANCIPYNKSGPVGVALFVVPVAGLDLHLHRAKAEKSPSKDKQNRKELLLRTSKSHRIVVGTKSGGVCNIKIITS